MASVANVRWGRILTAGALAGIAGGILFDLFIYATSVAPQHGSMLAVWQFIASTAIGKTAFASTGFAWLGLFIHLVVSIAWAIGYAYLAQTRSAIDAHPAVSGIAFGLVVYVVMQIVLLGDNNFHLPGVRDFALALIRHCIFFGLPVAYIVRGRSA
ncbi:MAG TPA: hypothetical protein VIG32_11080 [Candidatus Baltobacteraceae bacterium]|jgi:hypothetical protein